MAGSDRGSGRLRALLTGSALVGVAALLFAAGSRHHTPQAALADAGGSMAPTPQAVDDGFEPSDVRTRSVAVVMVIAVSVIALSIAGLVVMLRVMHARDQAGPPLTAQQTAPITPPGPPLQDDPLRDIAVLRAQEATTLGTYRWLGPAHASAQIPISRAMAIVVGRPLDPQAPATGTSP